MTELELLTIGDLQKLCKISKIKCESNPSKPELIKLLKKHFKIIDDQKFAKIRRLGIQGKEGTVWAIKYNNSRNPSEFALKQFRHTKSSQEMVRESELQKIASRGGISPKVEEVDIFGKFIVMELVGGETVFDRLKKSNGVMTISEQKEFVQVIYKLDKLGVYHGDPSPLNFIYDDRKKLKIIDFGFGRKIQKGEKDLNKKTMLLGFILKMKEIGVDVDKNYSYIKDRIDKDDLVKCGIR